MVSPWMEHGTVMHYLKTHGYANVDKLVSFCACSRRAIHTEIQLYEIAQGLEYLHSRNIIHGDLRGVHMYSPTFLT
jgi:serine/threonine protein kinase